MDSETIAELARRPLWSESELGYICLGINPDEHAPCTEPLNKVRENIRRAVLAKALVCVCPTDATAADQIYGHARFFVPSVAATWADRMGYSVPAEIPRADAAPCEQPPDNGAVTLQSALTTIGAMLALFLNDTDDGGNKMSPFAVQRELIQTLEDRNPQVRGLKERNMKGVFAAANKAIDEARKA